MSKTILLALKELIEWGCQTTKWTITADNKVSTLITAKLDVSPEEEDVFYGILHEHLY